MLNELTGQIRRYDMIHAGDTVICAVSGGADSMALLWGMYLLREKLQIRLEAAHFNHGLRGEESNRDARFVRQFCADYGITLHEGSGAVVAGKKGLEAAARDARYGFLDSLSGKIATAHTADDNVETVLMHFLRGTGLKGLGGIAPVSGKRIRPMLTVTREQVMAFLKEYSISYVTDSSNEEDLFLRNRMRHHVIPLLKQENPKLAENVSNMAMRLRFDEQALEELTEGSPSVTQLRSAPPALRARYLSRFLRENGVHEPEAEHIALLEKLVFSPKPSARADLPGGIRVTRNYDCLESAKAEQTPEAVELPMEGTVRLPQWGVVVTISNAEEILQATDVFTVCPKGKMILRSRQTGDEMTLAGGTKSLKKLLIDRKIPAAQRLKIPVIADEKGVLGVYGIGVNQRRTAEQLPAVQLRMIPLDTEKEEE